MEWNKKFNYPSSTRALIQGKRHYSLDGSNLPSVTTILSATKSEEDKAALAAWKERVGKLEADRIKKEASSRGSSIHKFIEEFLHGKLNQDLIDDNNHSKKMAEEIIDNGLKNKLGTIAMARTSNPHSATAQFFINVNDNYFLDFKNKTTRGFGYCVFGEVIDGLNIVLEISKTITGANGQFRDVPQDPILINQVELIN